MKADLRSSLTRAVQVPGGSSSDFDLNPGVILPENRVLKAAAVLIPVTEDGRVILTKRSAQLKHHPGQVAFPGGRQDPDDATLEDAALRETEEEIGLDREHIDILGRLPAHETVTAYQVTPVVALVNGSAKLSPELGEVAEIFHVPLNHFLAPGNFRVESRRWRGERRYYFTVPYGPYYIWGATARILRGLADRMQA